MDKSNLEFFKNVFFELKKNWKNETLETPDLLIQDTAGDEVDTALTERDRELSLKIAGRSRFFHKKIDDALERINAGTFGQCEECGDEIEFNRLKARPMTNLCICCKEEQEREEQSIPYTKRSHTLGKAIVGGVPLIQEENRPKFDLINSEIIN
ncbi:MAG: hypothetical protein OHK0056_07130 [Bacteriovoracaceae bacterium]